MRRTNVRFNCIAVGGSHRASRPRALINDTPAWLLLRKEKKEPINWSNSTLDYPARSGSDWHLPLVFLNLLPSWTTLTSEGNITIFQHPRTRSVSGCPVTCEDVTPFYFLTFNPQRHLFKLFYKSKNRNRWQFCKLKFRKKLKKFLAVGVALRIDGISVPKQTLNGRANCSFG